MPSESQKSRARYAIKRRVGYKRSFYAGEPGSFAGANTRRNGSYVVAACPTAQELSIHPLLLAVVVATGGGVTRTPLIILHS